MHWITTLTFPVSLLADSFSRYSPTTAEAPAGPGLLGKSQKLAQTEDLTEDHAETGEMSIFMEFTLGDYSIDSPEELNIPLGGTGNITVDDVVAADWNITKAPTGKIIDNQSFVGNVTHVEVPSDGTQPDGGGCSTCDQEYNSPFTASVEGTTIADGLPANDQDSLVSEICFDPLGIIAVVVDD